MDEEAAAVVKRIFDLCIAGKGPMLIAKILKTDKVLTTRAHYAKQKGKSLPDNPYSWNESTIVGSFGAYGLLRAYGKLQKLFKIPQAEKADSHHKRTAGDFPQHP